MRGGRVLCMCYGRSVAMNDSSHIVFRHYEESTWRAGRPSWVKLPIPTPRRDTARVEEMSGDSGAGIVPGCSSG